MEDGCSKRFDITTLALREDSYESMGHGARPMGGPMHLVGPPSSGLPPMAIPPLSSSGLLASMPPSLRGRDLMASDAHHGWGR